jgi:hypothetical protein
VGLPLYYSFPCGVIGNTRDFGSRFPGSNPGEGARGHLRIRQP